mmetsp:Transcript_42756/g.65709  ORF Transcript_42756/g.65709 Transcript_42756/m.65709 type:complete len:116 (-) Transcript_42756:501-848(-)
MYKLDHMSEAEKKATTDEMIEALSQQTSNVSEVVPLKEALFSEKHRYASWNGVLCAMMNPLSGVPISLAYQSKIFLQMRETGEFTLLPVIWSVQLMNVISMVASFGSSIPSKFFG